MDRESCRCVYYRGPKMGTWRAIAMPEILRKRVIAYLGRSERDCSRATASVPSSDLDGNSNFRSAIFDEVSWPPRQCWWMGLAPPVRNRKLEIMVSFLLAFVYKAVTLHLSDHPGLESVGYQRMYQQRLRQALLLLADCSNYASEEEPPIDWFIEDSPRLRTKARARR